MSPYTYLLLAFVLTVANRLYGKYTLNRVDSFALALSSNALGAIIAIPFVWPHLSSIQTITISEWGIILLLGVLWTYISWAGNISVAQNNYSLREIIRQTRIIWVVIAGVLFLNERISITDAIGILFITSSVFIVSYKQFSFREHISSKSILLAWSISFIAALTALLEKVIVDSIPVIVYLFLINVATVIFLLPCIRGERKVHVKVFATKHRQNALVCALLMFFSSYFILKAYSLFPISIAYPIIQSSTAICILLGTYFFEDNAQWARKLAAAIVAVIGVIVVKLF